MKNLSIGLKVFLLSSLIGVILITISSTILLNKVSDMENDVYKKKVLELKSILSQSIAGKTNIGLSNVISIANDKRVVDSLINNDREEAISVLAHISKKFREYTPYKNIKLHTKDTKSFLRA